MVASILSVTIAQAGSIKKNASIGVASVEVGDKTGTCYDVGFGYGTTDSGGYWGGAFLFEYANVNNINVIGYAADIRLGLSPTNSFSLYGIGAAMYQSVNDRENAGFGYGGGVEYRITDNIAVNMDYKTFNMKPSKIGFLDYDYTKTGVSVKYMF